MKWPDEQAARFWAVIAVGLGIGLLGAYGRERNEGRIPDKRWLLVRLAIMPFLALVGAAAADAFSFTSRVAGFVAALLALLGYDVVRVISSRALKRVDNTIADVLGPDHAAQVHPRKASDTMVVEEVSADHGALLKKAYRDVPTELGPEMRALLDKLHEIEARDKREEE